MMTVCDYSKEIQTAIKKYAGNRTEDEKNDLRQAAYLALLEAGNHVRTKKLARLVCRDAILRVLYRERPVGEDSIHDLSVFRKVEEQQSQEFDSASVLDEDKILETVDKLPPEESYIIIKAFGLGCEVETLELIARNLDRPTIWVRRRKVLALKKLREMMKVEE